MACENIGEDEFRLILGETRFGLALCTISGELLLVNQEYASIIGYTGESSLSLQYWKVTPRKFETVERQIVGHILSKKQYGPYIKQYVNKTKGLVPVRLWFSHIRHGSADLIWTVVEELRIIRTVPRLA